MNIRHISAPDAPHRAARVHLGATMPTLKVTLTSASWTRIDNSAVTVSGKVTSASGSVKMVYMDGTSAPATTPKNTTDDFVQHDAGEAFRYDMKTGDSLWAAATSFSANADSATIVVVRRT